MANPALPLYNFYFRYLWNPTDFAGWQDGMVSLGRGAFEGLIKGGVLQGAEVTPSGSGLAVVLTPFIATGPTGNLLVGAGTSGFALATANATNPRRDLIVARPQLLDDSFVVNPTNPFQQVPLKQLQATQIVVLTGTPAASPDYPVTGSNDVVLAGVRVAANATSLTDDAIDFEVRDIPGKNSRFQQNQGKYDDRLRPYRSSNTTVGIKPSQLFYPRAFTFANNARASTFPQDGSGDFVNGDTFVNMSTGAITGADAQSPDFTPTIPSSGNAIVATIRLSANDRLEVSYGTQGTRAQCYAGIRNQETSGAGSIGTLVGSALPIAYVIAYSGNGSAITEIDVVDARSPFTLAPTDYSYINAHTFRSAIGVWQTNGPVIDTSSGSGNDVKTGIYAGSRFVLIGQNIARWSVDGETWTQVSHTASSFGIGQQIAYGNGLYVAAGFNIVTSPDGNTWTQRVASADAQWVTFANGVFIAACANNVIRRSVDGITWTTPTSALAAGTLLYSAAFGNGVWVITGSSGRGQSSADNGLTWTSRTMNLSTNTIWRVFYLNTLFFAITDGGRLATSPDGTTWTAQTTPFAGTHPIQWATYLASKGIYILGGNSATGGRMAFSSNATAWTDAFTMTSQCIRVEPYEGLAGFECAVAMLFDGRMLTTFDGKGWTERNTGIPAALGMGTPLLINGGGKFVSGNDEFTVSTAWPVT